MQLIMVYPTRECNTEGKEELTYVLYCDQICQHNFHTHGVQVKIEGVLHETITKLSITASMSCS